MAVDQFYQEESVQQGPVFRPRGPRHWIQRRNLPCQSEPRGPQRLWEESMVVLVFEFLLLYPVYLHLTLEQAYEYLIFSFKCSQCFSLRLKSARLAAETVGGVQTQFLETPDRTVSIIVDEEVGKCPKRCYGHCTRIIFQLWSLHQDH